MAGTAAVVGYGMVDGGTGHGVPGYRGMRYRVQVLGTHHARYWGPHHARSCSGPPLGPAMLTTEGVDLDPVAVILRVVWDPRF